MLRKQCSGSSAGLVRSVSTPCVIRRLDSPQSNAAITTSPGAAESVGILCGANAKRSTKTQPLMALTKEQVLHVASLARLRLENDEVDRLVIDLGNILNHVDQLSQVDTSDVPPTEHLAVEALPLNTDEPQAGLTTETALAPAPRVLNEGFAVPAFVDEN